MSMDRLVHAGKHDGEFYGGLLRYGGRMATCGARRMA